MKRQTLALLASLLVVVAISGCAGLGTTTVGTGTAAGVIIKSFAPDMKEIFSGDSVIFSMSIENVGGSDATGINARIFGLGTDWTITGDRLQTVADLERSQPEFKVPGGSADVQWELTSPANLKVDNTYTANVRLSYHYTTTAVANVKVYSYDYVKSNPDKAEEIMTTSGLESYSVTNAPLTIEMSGLARPLIYKTGSTGQSAITFLISNVGQGKPYTYLGQTTDESNMLITVDSIRIGTAGTCANVVETSQRMPREGEKSIPCKFSLEAVEDYQTMPIEMTISYDYFVDSSSSIKVMKSLYVTEGATTGGQVPL